jgi:hypothetical protein
MEPLSPRSTNIQFKGPSIKEKASADAAAQKAERALKDKEHAPAPPEWVIQPPLRAGGLSERFRSGKYLGKGGFAICHEGSLGAKKYAMKIVKAKMQQKKTEEKVYFADFAFNFWRLTDILVSHRVTDPRQATTSRHCGVPSCFHVRRKHLRYSGTVS